MAKGKKTIDWRVVCTGLVCITALEGYALFLGFNGTLLKIALATLALAIGITIPNPFNVKK